MKRLSITAILTFLICLTAVLPAYGQEQDSGIAVFIDGMPVALDVQPVIQNSRTLVPFRAVVEALNTKVDWDSSNQAITAVKGSTNIKLQIGSTTAFRNGTPLTLDAPPMLYKNRTVIPLRFFAEAFDCQVTWDQEARTVNIFSAPAEMDIVGFYALGDQNTSSWTNLFSVDYPQTSRGNTDIVRELALGWYSLNREGNLLTQSTTGWQRPNGWESVLEAAAKYNLQTEMVIHMTDSGGQLVNLLANKEAKENAVNQIIKEAKLYNGVNLDFEGLGWQAKTEELQEIKENFNDFTRLLANRLRAEGLNLTLTLHPPNSSYKGYDYKALGNIADRIIVMAYDYGTTPEPETMVLQAINMAREVVAPEKLLLGISAPSENPESIKTKVSIAKQFNLSGIALWRLGVITPDMWDSLRATVKTRF